jgi:hypothetical protein
LEGELLFTFQQSLLSRSLRSLPPLLGLRPATGGAYPLGTPNSVPPYAVILLGACGTAHINSIHWPFSYVTPDPLSFVYSCSIHPRRPTVSDTLAGRFRKARHFPELYLHVICGHFREKPFFKPALL